MKQQHPENPELFRCSTCNKYKNREAFHKNRKMKNGIYYTCRDCRKHYSHKLYIENHEENKEKNKIRVRLRMRIPENRYRKNTGNKSYMQEYCERDYVKLRTQQWLMENKDQINKKRIDCLSNSYVKEKLKRSGLSVTPETIELKRQQIIMKRTLKEFKKWREEYESNHADVSGKQLTNEGDNERRLQAG